MSERVTLYAQRINHGQSEIWLGANGKELTQRRTLATNEVLNVARHYCGPEEFKAFYAELSTAIDQVAALAGTRGNEVAEAFGLKA